MFRGYLLQSYNGRTTNVALMVIGFSVGQGALFAAQTWLLSNGQMPLMAEFGLALSFVTISMLFVDYGTTIVLTRDIANNSVGEQFENRYFGIDYSAALVVRLCSASIVFLFFLFIFVNDIGNEFSRAYFLAASPALLIWVFNVTGHLDGLSRSGISGLASCFPYLASAVAVLIAAGQPLATAGTMLGTAYAVGQAITVSLQWVALHSLRRAPKIRTTGWTQISYAYRNGLGALLTQAPGQIYHRLQLIVAQLVLGSSAVALLVYVKQIVSAFAQLIGFLRRAEFPRLVMMLSKTPTQPLRQLMHAQIIGTLLGLGGTLMAATGGVIAWTTLDDPLNEAGRHLVLFSLLIGTGSLSLAFTQGLSAIGQYRAAGYIVLLATASGGLLSVYLSSIMGLSGFAIADTIANILVASLGAAYLSTHIQRNNM